MLKNFFKRRPSAPAGPRGAPGKRCYAIGDVHGCADELEHLLGLIKDDLSTRAPKPGALVMLGDLIDRGPDSRRVVELLMAFDHPDMRLHVIAGNHEEMLVIGLREDPSVLPNWLRHGGYAYCESYGVSPEEIMGVDDDTIRRRILAAVPDDHLAFLENTVERVRFGDYLLVHAGINPARPIDDQESRDLRWIRDDFLFSEKNFGAIVVHGHTVVEEVEHHSNRIAIDTGAYRTGRLSALRLEDHEQEVLITG